ncbi:MAG: type II secretion system minor pseudopilin GspK [Pseudomonadota bacterium]
MSAPRDQGAALLSVLLLISIMSVAAVAVTEVVAQSAARSKAADDRSRANWYLIGAEELGKVALTDLVEETGGNLTPAVTQRFAQPFVFEAEGGVIQARLRDATNCFNLNSLQTNAEDLEDEDTAGATPISRYRILLEQVGFSGSEARALADAAADWVDTDTITRLSGAEDAFYSSRRPPHRAPGRLFADITELRAVRGYERRVVAALDGLVCVRPDTANAVLNLNTLTIDDAPLLSMALTGLVSSEAARVLIEERPEGGWPDVATFLEERDVAEIAPGRRREDLMDIVSKRFELSGAAAYRDGLARFRVLYAVEEGRPVEIIQRTYGEF